MPLLKLSVHGQIIEFVIPEEFNVDTLREYCEVENIKKDQNQIYAKVSYFSRPFSELKSVMVESINNWDVSHGPSINHQERKWFLYPVYLFSLVGFDLIL